MWFRDPEVSFRLKGTPSGMDQPTHFSSLEFAQVSGTQISGPSLLSFVLLRWYQQQTQNNTYLVWLLRWQDSPLYQPSIHSQPSKNTKHRAQYYMQPPVEEPWWILEAWPPGQAESGCSLFSMLWVILGVWESQAAALPLASRLLAPLKQEGCEDF